MTRLRRGSSLALLLLLVLCATARAYAAEQGSTAAHEHAVELFEWMNFAIVAGLLGWVFLKVTPPIFRDRAETISRAITTAAAAKAEADRQLRDAEGKLARLQDEVAQLQVTAEQEAKAEAERIRNVTNSDAQKIRAAGKAEIEAAERAARLALKAIAANLAVDRAESLLARQLTPQTQEALLAYFMKTLEGRPN
jgi:F-type H+-transporting ATPase subunit b